MAYGIEIKNQDGVTIIDNTPFHVLEVIESGTMSSGAAISTSVDPNAVLFVRPSVSTAVIYGSESYTSNGKNLSVTSGIIEYVKLKTCRDSSVPVSGYGLVVYDNQTTPLLVFKDSMRYARMVASVSGSLGTIGIPMNVSLPSKKKFIAAHSLGIINFYDTFYSTVAAAFVADDSYITLTRNDISFSGAGGGGRTLTRQFNVIEC